jgi:muconate cycloisomerase
MPIREVEAIVVDVPLREPVHGVHGLTAVQRSVLVRVAGDDGLEGWGNVDPSPGYSLASAEEIAQAVTVLAPGLRGADAGNINRTLALVDREGAGPLEARAAIEMALWDLRARALGIPVHALLGGAVRTEVTFNAWIGTVPAAQAAREAAAWRDRGFRTAKIKLSGGTREGLERVAAVRDAVGEGMDLRVDFNESLPRAEAVGFIRQLEPFGLTLVEQPLPRDDVAGLAAIRREIRIPLMADESVTGPASLLEIIRREAADIVKVKVMKQGGLAATLQMVDLAAAAGLRVVIGHGFGLTPSTLAEATVAALRTAVMPGCEAVGPLKMAGDVVTDPVVLDAGSVRLPDTPGLGARIDPDAVKRYRVP